MLAVVAVALFLVGAILCGAAYLIVGRIGVPVTQVAVGSTVRRLVGFEQPIVTYIRMVRDDAVHRSLQGRGLQTIGIGIVVLQLEGLSLYRKGSKTQQEQRQNE